MRYYFLGIVVFLLCFVAACKQQDTPKSAKGDSNKISKSDLKKLDWIEGNWRCTLEGVDFYQLHQVVDDSTMMVLTYQYNGKDSSQSKAEYFRWKDGKFIFGANGEWEALAINPTEVQLSPTRPNWNQISWMRGSSPEKWTVKMTMNGSAREFPLQKAPPLDELLKK